MRPCSTSCVWRQNERAVAGETIRRTLTLLLFENAALKVADSEPPRIRTMRGAIGE